MLLICPFTFHAGPGDGAQGDVLCYGDDEGEDDPGQGQDGAVLQLFDELVFLEGSW